MKYKMGGHIKKPPEPVRPLSKGPQGRRRYPGQNEADKKRREAMQAVEDRAERQRLIIGLRLAEVA